MSIVKKNTTDFRFIVGSHKKVVEDYRTVPCLLWQIGDADGRRFRISRAKLTITNKKGEGGVTERTLKEGF